MEINIDPSTQDFVRQYAAISLPIFFVTLWLAVTTVLGLFSGWFFLMHRFPDRNEQPLLQLRGQSGSLGIVGMNGILRLAVCPSGLRVGMFRLFGPFSRDFFVPWSELKLSRRNFLAWELADLRFGSTGKLSVQSSIANRLAQAAPGKWPESASATRLSADDLWSEVVREWLIRTAVGSGFLILVTQFAEPRPAGPPIVLAILMPALVFGVAGLIKYMSLRPK